MQPGKAPLCLDFYSANKQADLWASLGVGTAISAAPWWAVDNLSQGSGGPRDEAQWRTSCPPVWGPVPRPPRTPEVSPGPSSPECQGWANTWMEHLGRGGRLCVDPQVQGQPQPFPGALAGFWVLPAVRLFLEKRCSQENTPRGVG